MIINPWIFYLINVLISFEDFLFVTILVLMLVSSYVTTDNIETVGDVIQDSVDYIFEKTK